MKAIRLAPLAVLLAGPAVAHVSDTAHLHESDAIPLVLGLALIAAAVTVGAVVRVRNR